MSLLVVGSVAFDALESPYGKVERTVGGAATYFAVAASFFAPVSLVAIVGDDFVPIGDNGTEAARKLATTAAVLLFLAAAGAAQAETVSDTFIQGNKLYEEGKYSQSAALYDELLRASHVSPAIYFNAGNAWFNWAWFKRSSWR